MEGWVGLVSFRFGIMEGLDSIRLRLEYRNRMAERGGGGGGGGADVRGRWVWFR